MVAEILYVVLLAVMIAIAVVVGALVRLRIWMARALR